MLSSMLVPYAAAAWALQKVDNCNLLILSNLCSTASDLDSKGGAILEPTNEGPCHKQV